MAERLQVTKPTLRRLETGDPGVGMGVYATALYVLGMIARLSDLADISHDTIGREIASEDLPQRIRAR